VRRFAEQVTGLTARHARRSSGLRATLEAIGLALAGRRGAVGRPSEPVDQPHQHAAVDPGAARSADHRGAAGCVPAYTAVLVTSSVTKTGDTITGTKPIIAIVQVNPGYAPSPGHPGTAKVLGFLCP
jgi:hypothetical protein